MDIQWQLATDKRYPSIIAYMVLIDNRGMTPEIITRLPYTYKALQNRYWRTGLADAPEWVRKLAVGLKPALPDAA